MVIKLKAKDIQAAVAGLIGTSIAQNIFLQFLNEAIDDVSMDYGPQTSADVTFVPNIEQDLPANFLSLISAVYDAGTGGTQDVKESLEITEYGKMKCNSAITLKLYYTTPAAHITDVETEPGIHQFFHPYLAYYVAMRYYKKRSQGDAEDLTIAANYEREYMEGKDKVIDKLTHRKTGNLQTRTVYSIG